MPIIPDPMGIQRRIPVGRQSVSSYRDPGAGQFEKGIGDLLLGINDQRQKSNLAKAENEFLLKKAKQDNAYDEDDEYSTIESRWTQNVEESLSEAASKIPDPALREEFVARQRVRIEEGRQRMEEVARKKEYDFERADLSQRLEDTVAVGIEGGDFVTAYKSAENLISTNIALSEQEKEKLRQDVKTRIATGRLDYLPPERRMEEVKKLKGHLPPDVLAKYQREAESAMIDEKAQSAVDAVMQSGMSDTERRSQIDKMFKGDTKARDEANRRLDYRLAKEQEAQTDRRKELHDEYFLEVREGRMQVTDIPMDEREAMGASVVNSLYAAQNARTSGTALKSDRQVLFDLHQMNSSDDPNVKRQMKQYFIENSHRLGQTDFNNWAKVVSDAETPPEVKSMLTAQQTVMGKIAKQNLEGYAYSKDDERFLLEEVNQWHQTYQATHDGKSPSDQERDAKIDQLLLRFPTSGGFLGMGRGEMPLFQMSGDEIRGALEQANQENSAMMGEAMRYVQQEGVDIKSVRGQRRVLQAYKILTEE